MIRWMELEIHIQSCCKSFHDRIKLRSLVIDLRVKSFPAFGKGKHVGSAYINPGGGNFYFADQCLRQLITKVQVFKPEISSVPDPKRRNHIIIPAGS